MDSSTPQLSRHFILLVAIFILTPLSIQFYAIGMPLIGDALVSTDTNIQLSMSIFFFGIAFAQLFFGPFSDHFGRMHTLIIGLSLFFIASLLGTMVFHAWLLYASRLLQGIAIGATSTVCYASVKDVYHQQDLVTRISYLSVASQVTLMFAPALAAVLLHFFAWYMIFNVFALYSVILLYLSHKSLCETAVIVDKRALKPKALIKAYYQLLFKRNFVGFTLLAGLSLSVPIVIGTMLPFIFFDLLLIPTIGMGTLISVISSGYLVGVLVAAQVHHRYGVRTIVNLGILTLCLMSAIALFMAAYDLLNLGVVCIPLFFVCFGAGLIFPNSIAGALTHQERSTGFVAALMSFGITIVCGFSTLWSAYLHEQSQMPMLQILLCIGLISALVYWLLVHRDSKN